jgi:hypothetical protein
MLKKNWIVTLTIAIKVIIDKKSILLIAFTISYPSPETVGSFRFG